MQSLIEEFDESSALLQTQYDRVQKLRDEGGNHETKIDALRVLHDCFLWHTEKINSAMNDLKISEEQEADDLEEEVHALEMELKLLTQTAEGKNAEGQIFPSFHKEKIEGYQIFVTQLADFSAQLSVLRMALQKLLSQTPLQIVTSSASLLSWCGVTNKETWNVREKQLQTNWKSIGGRAEIAGIGMNETTMIATRDLLNEVIILGKRVVNYALEGNKIHEEQLKTKKQFQNQQRRLVIWCRQQQANIDALKDPDHIQEFCASLLEHYKVMSGNYRVLLETADSFLNDEKIQEELLEANEAWIHLQIKALERLRHTLFEVHERTLLEEHVEEHANFCLQIGPFIEELVNSLTATRDENSPLHERCVKLTQDCESLRQILQEHESLCKRLMSFAERMRVAREAYNCYRASALSRVTYLSSSSDILAEASRRKEEYEGCVEELQAWANEKARSDSWRDIREKIRCIKQLLEKENQVVEKEKNATEL